MHGHGEKIWGMQFDYSMTYYYTARGTLTYLFSCIFNPTQIHTHTHAHIWKFNITYSSKDKKQNEVAVIIILHVFPFYVDLFYVL